MAHRKRSRDISDVDGEVEVESASSSLQQHQLHKKSRLAMAQRNGGSVVSDDDDDDEAGIAPADSDDDEDDDMVDLWATQVVQKEHRQHRINTASEYGVIEEVFCRNFMCHSKLRIKLGPLINFIIGHNGSGKSAVLTALTMCLGGKATATNRGASLKSLIKEGTDNATLAVKIKNQGEGGYKPDIYGRSITVERHFTRTGASGFKLKNEHDKVISTKKADLDDILDFFAFQLDNPINVLTQDLARQFLSNSSPADKYKFWIRGTQLETLDADYKLLEENLDNIEQKLETRKQDISILKEKVDQAEARKKIMDRAESMAQKIAKLRWQHAWAQVEEQEEALVKCNSMVQEAKDNVQAKIDEAETVDGAYEGHNQAFESAKRTRHDLEERLQPVKESFETANDNMKANRSTLTNILGQERECRGEMKRIKKGIARIQHDVQAEQQVLAEAEGGEHVERLSRLDELKEQVVAKQQQYDEHLAGRAALQSREADAFQALRASQQPFQQCQQEVEKAENALRNLRANQGDEWGAYRKGMKELVGAINRETRFRTKPVGPMGKYIKILKPEWTSPVEKTMGGNMEAFIVTSKEDQNLLSQVMHRTQCKCPILIGNDHRLDTTGKEPIEEVDTMLRILNIDNELVRNSLIINQAADQTVLIPNPEEARRFFYGGSKPLNVKVVLAFAAQRGAAIRYEFSGRGAQKSSNVDPYNGVSHLTADMQAQIRMQLEAVNHATRDRDEAREAKRRLEEASTAAKSNVNKFDARSKHLRVQVQQAQDAVEQQQNLIDSKRPEDGKLQELERQLGEAKSELEGQESSFEDITNAKDDANTAAQELKRVLDEADAEQQTAQANVERAEQRLVNLDGKRTTALRSKNLAIQLIDQAKEEQTQAEQARDKQAQTVEAFIGQAEQISPRIEVPAGVTAEQLDARLGKLVDDRRQVERDAGGTKEELTLAYLESRGEYEAAESVASTMTAVAKDLKKTLDERERRWKKFRRFISSRTRTTFMYLLSERNFRGRVLMDHSGKELDIRVEPDLSKDSDKGRATKTLSGGEKSFSTICLLLSIWDAMGSPIRCLDEFDVFMDSVNRSTSMKMMIEAARNATGRQFVLITPQSMDATTLGNDVKINRMSDPERGQTVLEVGA